MIILGIKGGMEAKGIWKQDAEANILAQEGCEWRMGSGEDFTTRNFIVCTIHLIQSGGLILEDSDGQGHVVRME